MDSITLKLIGESPLLMHSDRYSNPLDPLTKAHKALTSKRKKTDEDHEAIAKSEWIGGLYHSDEHGPYMPSINVRSAIVDGAKLNKLGMQVKRATVIIDDELPLEYSGPRDIEAMWRDPRFRDARSVVVQSSRLMRYRPKFAAWSLTVTVHFDQGVIESADLIRAAENAGKLIGIGDFRPNKGGSFGRFRVEVVQ